MKTEVLVDTSVWIDHFVSPNPNLEVLMDREQVLCHPMVLGELACGNLKDRRHTLKWLQEIAPGTVVSQGEVEAMVEALELYGRGLGWIDAHLIASALLSGTSLYTHDRALIAAASELGVLAA
jgi:predicted nucleic acid-binding protein